MDIHSETDLIVVKIIHRVKMSKEGIADQEKIFVFTGQLALVDDEVTFVIVCLV